MVKGINKVFIRQDFFFWGGYRRGDNLNENVFCRK